MATITDSASRLKFLASTHRMSRAMQAYAKIIGMDCKWVDKKTEAEVGQILLHVLEAQKFMHHVVNKVEDPRSCQG